jgi:hypothetical protein
LAALAGAACACSTTHSSSRPARARPFRDSILMQLEAGAGCCWCVLHVLQAQHQCCKSISKFQDVVDTHASPGDQLLYMSAHPAACSAQQLAHTHCILQLLLLLNCSVITSAMKAELVFSATSICACAHGTAIHAEQHCNRNTLQLTSSKAIQSSCP